MWSGVVGGLIGLALVWMLGEWRWRARFLGRVADHSCRGCGAPFSDAIATYIGPVGATQRERLDAFQRRFAAYLVRCGDCGAVNICTRQGQPFRATGSDAG